MGARGVEKLFPTLPSEKVHVVVFRIGLDRIGLGFFVDWFFERNEGGEGKRGERMGRGKGRGIG